MTKVLQLPHLVEDNGVSQMEVWRSRVKAQLDTQRGSGLFGTGEFLRKFRFDDQFIATTFRYGKCLFDRIGQRQFFCRRRHRGIFSHR